MYKLVTLKYKLDFKSTYKLGLRFKYFTLRARHIIMWEITLMQRLCYDRLVHFSTTEV